MVNIGDVGVMGYMGDMQNIGDTCVIGDKGYVS